MSSLESLLAQLQAIFGGEMDDVREYLNQELAHFTERLPRVRSLTQTDGRMIASLYRTNVLFFELTEPTTGKLLFENALDEAYATTILIIHIPDYLHWEPLLVTTRDERVLRAIPTRLLKIN